MKILKDKLFGEINDVKSSFYQKRSNPEISINSGAFYSIERIMIKVKENLKI
jgi:hypothetical protein